MKFTLLMQTAVVIGMASVGLFACGSVEQVVRTNGLTGSRSWTLRQTGAMSGEQTAYASPDGAKVEIKEMGIGYLSKAPDWNIVMYNNKAKVYCEFTQEEFLARKKKQLEAMRSSAAPYQKGISESIAGLTADQYVSKSGSDTTEVWLTEAITMPESAVKILKRPSADGLPSKGVPLRMVVVTDGKRTTVLDTVSCDRNPIPSSTFALQKGYRQVADEMSVLAP